MQIIWKPCTCQFLFFGSCFSEVLPDSKFLPSSILIPDAKNILLAVRPFRLGSCQAVGNMTLVTSVLI